MVYFTTSTASTRLLLDRGNNQEDVRQIIILLSTNCISFEENVRQPYIDDIYESSITIDNIGTILLFRFIICHHYLHDLNNFCHQMVSNIIQYTGISEEKIAIVAEEY